MSLLMMRSQAAPTVASGNDNPDGLALATVVNGNTFDSDDGSVISGSLGFAIASWGSGYGWDGGGWRIVPNGTDADSEQNCGAVLDGYITSSDYEYADNQQTIGLAMLMYFEPQFATYLDGTGGNTMSMKWSDIFFWDGAGSNPQAGRQTVILDRYDNFGGDWGNATAGGYFGLTNGGAGVSVFTDPYGSTPLRVSTVSGQWVWLHLYTTTAGANSGFTALYYKVEGDSGVSRSCLRRGDDNVYTWQDPGDAMAYTDSNSSGRLSGTLGTLAGYLENTINGDNSIYYGIDNVQVGNGYLTPPAGF